MFERLIISLALLAAGAGAYVIWQQVYIRRATVAVTAQREPTILYFHSATCAPCTMQSRFLREVGATFGHSVRITEVDADTQSDMTSRYRVFTVPTTLIVDSAGAVTHANYGLTPARKLAAQVQSILDKR